MRLRLAVAASLLAGAAASFVSQAPASWLGLVSTPDWQEIAWPFGRDGWPTGRAFRCTSLACGGTLDVYVRPKIGLCNCATGVSGDAEVDAVSDVDLISDDFVPLADGQVITIAGMTGRMRAYTQRLPGGHTQRSAGLVLAHRCDLVAAASQGAAAGTAQAASAITLLLQRADVMGWMLAQMGKT